MYVHNGFFGRKHREKQFFSFCAKGKWASGVHISKEGKGLRETWLKQIQQFNRVSPAVASAVAQAYPSPSLLLQVSSFHRLLCAGGREGTSREAILKNRG